MLPNDLVAECGGGLCDSDNFEEAIEHLTEAILLNPASAIMYATRGTLSYPMESCLVPWLLGRYYKMRFCN